MERYGNANGVAEIKKFLSLDTSIITIKTLHLKHDFCEINLKINFNSVFVPIGETWSIILNERL